jgi:hypothetical protein
MSSTTRPLQVVFDSTPEIYASDSKGGFSFPLLADGSASVATHEYDETRFVISIWHPSNHRNIALDRAYVELRGSFEPDQEHWIKLAEIEPVVSPYNSGDTFDGWIVLPVFAKTSAFSLAGQGFQSRARLQIRTTLYLVS